jgi:hypothetical protein
LLWLPLFWTLTRRPPSLPLSRSSGLLLLRQLLLLLGLGGKVFLGSLKSLGQLLAEKKQVKM